MAKSDRSVVWLAGEVKTPPFTKAARMEAGFLLRRLQKGEKLGMPHARPMPSVGKRCSELRIRDEKKNWRIMVRCDSDAIVVTEVFEKKTRTTAARLIEICKDRLRRYDEASKG